MCDAERAQLADQFLTLSGSLPAEALAQLPAVRVDAELPARLGVDQPEVSDIRQLLLSLFANLDRYYVVTRGEVKPALKTPTAHPIAREAAGAGTEKRPNNQEDLGLFVTLRSDPRMVKSNSRVFQWDR